MDRPAEAKFHFEITVREEDIDELDHANNLVYLKWSLKAAVAHSSHVGWTPERYRELGAGFVVRSHSIKYKRPARLGDCLTVVTWVDNMLRVSSLRKYEIRLGSRLLALAETNWAFVEFETQKLRPIPAEIVNSFVVSR